jgi:hypothetical protein
MKCPQCQHEISRMMSRSSPGAKVRLEPTHVQWRPRAADRLHDEQLTRPTTDLHGAVAARLVKHARQPLGGFRVRVDPHPTPSGSSMPRSRAAASKRWPSVSSGAR